MINPFKRASSNKLLSPSIMILSSASTISPAKTTSKSPCFSILSLSLLFPQLANKRTDTTIRSKKIYRLLNNRIIPLPHLHLLHHHLRFLRLLHSHLHHYFLCLLHLHSHLHHYFLRFSILNYSHSNQRLFQYIAHYYSHV